MEVASIDETAQTVICSRFLRSWKGLEAIRFVAISVLGLVAKIDVPNIHISPERYGVSNVVFKAGFRMAIGALTSYASQAQYRQEQRSRLSAQRAGFTNGGRCFDFLGDGKSALYVKLKALLRSEEAISLREILAMHNKSPQIPCCGAIALARKMAAGSRPYAGRFPLEST